MSVHAARTRLEVVLRKLSYLRCKSMEGGENQESLGYVLKSMYPEEDRSYLLHCGATLQSATEATVDLHCKTVCINKLFGDVNIFRIVLSEKDNFFHA